jgi:LuxR family maltose regulon positive regulatory protein
VDRVEVRCRLALGDLEGAVLILRYLAPELQTAELLASIDLCAARPDRAVARLTAFLDRPTAVGVDIERLTLLARAQLQLGDRRRADDALRRAIELGRPERYIRVFLDGARELLPLLRGIAGTYPDAYVAELLSHAERDDISLAADSAPGALEPLTDRERELLSYLPSHLSQHEIADVTYISLNTVKTHIKGVYRKLGAKSRSEAVALAREHGLL